MTVDALVETTRAGSNCGSCKPELRTLLNAVMARVAAE
jgi:NAD(P)H-nitrite reductase large subunit